MPDSRETLLRRRTTTTRGERAARDAGARLCLVVVGEGQDAVFPLPERGKVQLGRSDAADVRIDHRSVSRNHAVVTLGARVTVEDLGSGNGTRVRGAGLRRGAPVEVELGEPFEVGAVTAVVQRRAPAAAIERHVWAHGHFELRVAEERARATALGGRFALVRVHVEPAGDGDGDPAAWEDALGGALRAMDVVGAWGPGEYEVLLPDAAAASASAVAAAIVAALAAVGATARTGAACFPADGRDPFALLERADAAARGATPARDAADARPGRAGAPRLTDAATPHLERLVPRVAAGASTVLVIGEAGVGTAALAERLHRASPRAGRPLVRVDCAMRPEAELERALFGRAPAADAGAADPGEPGAFEAAAGGTVLLDEVGALPTRLQVALVRVVEERAVRRAGARAARPVDARVIATTSADLDAEIARGAFRADLHARLAGVVLVIPPLRQRAAELPGLAAACLAALADAAGRPAPHELSPEAAALLAGYPWPGNLAELEAVLDRAARLAGDGVITAAHLPVEKLRRERRAAPPRPAAPPAPAAPAPLDPRARERARIIQALADAGGNQTDAAKLLGISRRTLINRVIAYQIPRPRKK